MVINMKSLIIYTSQTGFTKRYAEWIAGELGGETMELKEAKKKRDDFFADYDAIAYGGWSMAGKTVSSEWFLQKAANWKGKKLAVFCVGASTVVNPDVEKNLQSALSEEQKTYMKAFYCPGGINYDAMKLPSRLILKGLYSSISKKANPTEEEKGMAECLAKSFDGSDIKYAKIIADYLN